LLNDDDDDIILRQCTLSRHVSFLNMTAPCCKTSCLCSLSGQEMLDLL